MVFTTLAVMEREDVKREIAKQRVFNALLDLIVSAKWNNILMCAVHKAINNWIGEGEDFQLAAVLISIPNAPR